MTRPWLLAAFGALGAACGDTTTTGVTELNLDRPVDVSFACYGKMRLTSNGQITRTAMPAVACENLSPPLTAVNEATGDTMSPSPLPGQENIPADPDELSPNPDWYGFILQSASGTVAIATWPSVPADSMAPAGLTLQFSDSPSGLVRVLDADPLTPGKNAISIGEDPIAIVTDKAGCFEVTANAGSCDLSELDITGTLDNISANTAARPRIDRVPVTTPSGAPILAKPAAMIVQPFVAGTDTVGNACAATATGQVYIAYPSCHLVAEVQLGADPSGTATAKVIGGIRFDDTGAPSVLDAAGLAGLSCPTECAPRPGAARVAATPGVRPVALDYKLDVRTDLSKDHQTSRLAIGADIGAVLAAKPLTVVDLDVMTFDPVASSLVQIALDPDGGPVGVSALALSPQIGMGGNATDSNGSVNDQTNNQAQYVYAVATDGTVRVADILTLNRECDTQIDGRFLRDPASPLSVPPQLDCLPMHQPGLPRRSGARSPGIELPGGVIANSVAIIKGLTAPPVLRDLSTHKQLATGATGAPGHATLLGYFAIISASSGAVYVANVDDDYAPDEFSTNSSQVVGTSPVLVMAHQLRDDFALRDDLPRGPSTSSNTAGPLDCKLSDGHGGATAGGPRLSLPPAQQFLANTLRTDLNGQLPRLQQIRCISDSDGDAPGPDGFPITALEFGAPATSTAGDRAMRGPAISRDAVYPDLASVRNEIWALTYEGTLASDNTINAINGPSVRRGQAFVDRNGMFIEDAAGPFCAMGIEPGDIVDLRGCNPANLDNDCPAGYTCYVHPQSIVSVGACFLKSEAPRLRDACRDFLSSIRRYTVGTDPNGRTEASKLVLLQRKHELSTTPIDGCVSDDQCDDLARAALVINQSADPFTEAPPDTPPEKRPTHWSCMADPLRKPISSDPARNQRCVQVCTPKANPNDMPSGPSCASGTICVADPSSIAGGVCMEGIEPPQACLNGPQRYDVRAGEAFAVIGTQSGFVHPIVTDSDGSCKVDPNLAQDPLSRGRIPLKAPACDPTADPITGLLPDKTFEANPCSLTVQQVEFAPTYTAPSSANPPSFGACTLVQQSATPDVRTAVPAIKFRNRAMTLTLVDPYRPAAASCLMRDPGGVPTNVPFAVTGYQIAFEVKGEFRPFTLALNNQVSPVKVVRGPTDSIWVIDDGDSVPVSFLDASTRGRVFRVESVPAFGTASLLTNILQ